MLYLTCTMLSSVDLAYYGVFRAKNRVSVNCGTKSFTNIIKFHLAYIMLLAKIGAVDK